MRFWRKKSLAPAGIGTPEKVVIRDHKTIREASPHWLLHGKPLAPVASCGPAEISAVSYECKFCVHKTEPTDVSVLRTSYFRNINFCGYLSYPPQIPTTTRYPRRAQISSSRRKPEITVTNKYCYPDKDLHKTSTKLCYYPLNYF